MASESDNTVHLASCRHSQLTILNSSRQRQSAFTSQQKKSDRIAVKQNHPQLLKSA